VDAISGATISSSAVVDAIKKTTLKKIKLLQENANETGG
ncbi:MAG: FMN-binding protein, partial [Thermoplasmatales archaeon]